MSNKQRKFQEDGYTVVRNLFSKEEIGYWLPSKAFQIVAKQFK